MTRSVRRVAAAGVMLAALAVGASGQSVGSEFPNFDGKDLLTGERISLKDLRGRIVLVDFWATWCPPCVAEIPNVKEVYKRYHDKGFEIVSISLDKDANTAKRYVEQNEMNWFHIAEGGMWETRLAKKFAIQSIPQMYLLDANGVVVSTEARGEALAPAVERAIKKTPPRPGPIGQARAEQALAEADRLRDAKEHLAALEAYEAIIKNHGDSPAGKTATERRDALLSDPATAAAIEAARAEKKQAEAQRQAGTWLEMARSLAKNKRYDAARKYYERVIEAVPDSDMAVEAKAEVAKLPK